MEDINATLQPTVTVHYASFWRRFAAYFIDGTILNTAFLPLTCLFLRNSGLWDLINISRKLPSGAGDLFSLVDPTGYAILVQNVFREISYFFIIESVFILLYYAVWESSKFQATPGKIATGIRVSTMDGQRISFLRALGRNLAKILSGIILMIGYIMAAFTERNQALHDMIANCVITRTEPISEPTATYGYAGFWRRFVAYLLDSILLYIILSPINFILMPTKYKNPFQLMVEAMKHPNAPLPDINDIILIMTISTLSALITFFYFASWESSRFQATPGKMAIGIKVIDIHGQRLSFWHAAGRYVAKFVSGLTLLIGYMMAGWTKHSQALHDELTNCLVIKGEN